MVAAICVCAQAAAISSVWATEAEAVLKRVQNEQFGPKTLDSVSWTLNLQSSEDTQGRMSKPTGEQSPLLLPSQRFFFGGQVPAERCCEDQRASVTGVLCCRQL